MHACTRTGLLTETDVDMADVCVRHGLSPTAVTDILEVIQKACSRGRISEEPFSLNFKALQSRVANVEGVGNSGPFKPTGSSTPLSVRCVQLEIVASSGLCAYLSVCCLSVNNGHPTERCS